MIAVHDSPTDDVAHTPPGGCFHTPHRRCLRPAWAGSSVPFHSQGWMSLSVGRVRKTAKWHVSDNSDSLLKIPTFCVPGLCFLGRIIFIVRTNVAHLSISITLLYFDCPNPSSREKLHRKFHHRVQSPGFYELNNERGSSHVSHRCGCILKLIRWK